MAIISCVSPKDKVRSGNTHKLPNIQKLNSGLYNSLISNNPDKAMDLLKKGANPNAQTNKHRYLIEIAVDHGMPAKVIRAFFDAGLKYKKDRAGLNLIMRLAATNFADQEQGYANLIQWLAQDRGFNINAHNVEGKTAVMLAAENGNAIIVKKLIELGADIHVKDKNGHTALYNAMSGGLTNKDAIKVLIRHTDQDDLQTCLKAYGFYIGTPEETLLELIKRKLSAK